MTATEISASEEIRAVTEILRSAQSVAITSHLGVDGDSAGSALALLSGLERLGIGGFFTNETAVPPYLDFLPGLDRFVRPVDEAGDFDLGIVLDTSEPERAGKGWRAVSRAERRILVDHHTGAVPEAFDAVYQDPSCPAVAFQIAEIMKAMGIGITREEAICLFTGLMTDTGVFVQSNANAETFRLAAELIEIGAVPFEIAKKVYERRTPGGIRLLGRALAGIEISRDGKIAWSVLSRRDFEECAAVESDVEGIVKELRGLDGIECAVLFRELAGGEVKATFRSKEGLNVAEIAARFGGGGHEAASGCTLRGSAGDVVEKVLNETKKSI